MVAPPNSPQGRSWALGAPPSPPGRPFALAAPPSPPPPPPPGPPPPPRHVAPARNRPDQQAGASVPLRSVEPTAQREAPPARQMELAPAQPLVWGSGPSLMPTWRAIATPVVAAPYPDYVRSRSSSPVPMRAVLQAPQFVQSPAAGARTCSPIPVGSGAGAVPTSPRLRQRPCPPVAAAPVGGACSLGGSGNSFLVPAAIPGGSVQLKAPVCPPPMVVAACASPRAQSPGPAHKQPLSAMAPIAPVAMSPPYPVTYHPQPQPQPQPQPHPQPQPQPQPQQAVSSNLSLTWQPSRRNGAAQASSTVGARAGTNGSTPQLAPAEASTSYGFAAGAQEQKPTSQEILDQCKDTNKLVSQLAMTIRSLEADVDSLRRENRNLQRTMAQTIPSALQRPEQQELDQVQAPQDEHVILGDEARAVPRSPQDAAQVTAPRPSGTEHPLTQPAIGSDAASGAQSVRGSADEAAGQLMNATGGAAARSAVQELQVPPPVPVPVMIEAASAPSAGTPAVEALSPQSQPEAAQMFAGAEEETSAGEMLKAAEEHAWRGDADAAEACLQSALELGTSPVAVDAFDAVADAFDRTGNEAKVEEWVGRAVELGLHPSEQLLEAAIVAACNRGDADKSENLMNAWLQTRLPTREAFNMSIRLFVGERDAQKVEQWLLRAGQSGWTPDQDAFESVVLLYAESSAAKAEEWLSRALQTDYTLPDAVYEAVVRAFLRDGPATKANDWLARMHGERRECGSSSLREAARLSVANGDVVHAEAWVSQLAAQGDASVDQLRRQLFDVALEVRDPALAERQLAALGREPDSERTRRLILAYADLGDAARAKAVLERYRALGGLLTSDISDSLLAACATLGDASGAEATARALAAQGPLTANQALLLRTALQAGGGMDEQRVAAVVTELCGQDFADGGTGGARLGLDDIGAAASAAASPKQGSSASAGNSSGAKRSTGVANNSGSSLGARASASSGSSGGGRGANTLTRTGGSRRGSASFGNRGAEASGRSGRRVPWPQDSGLNEPRSNNMR